MSLKFAIQLLDENIVSQDQFIDLVRKHEDSCLPSMAIAISQNFITIRQARQILELQTERPELTFEEAAYEFGILSIEQCRKIASAQENSRRGVERIAVDAGVCTKDQIDAFGQLLSKKSPVKHQSNLPTPKFSRHKPARQTNASVYSRIAD
jgi:hypothetical protein